MPTRETFLEAFLELPLIQGLQTCARRLRIRFAIRGGVLRNYLFELTAGNAIGRDFYEFVDPFSDIDIVVDSAAEWSLLAQAISESIPFAGFHRWEALPTGAMHESSQRFTLIPADRLLVWFDGRQGDSTRLFLEGLDVNVAEVVEHPTLAFELNWNEPSGEGASFTRILDLLRLARYAFSFPHIPAGFEPGALLRRAGIRRIESVPPIPEKQYSLELRRLELAILDLVFTATDFRPVSRFLDECREELPSAWLERSKLLSSIFYQASLNAGAAIGVVLYKPGPQSTLRTRIFTDTQSAPPALRNTKSVIPWLRVSSSGHNPNDCCNYRDFENGVATVTWRLKSQENAFLDIPESGFAAVAAVPPSAQEYTRSSGLEPLMLSLPGFVRKGRSLVLRVDHGYVRGYLNRNASFYLGLVPISLG